MRMTPRWPSSTHPDPSPSPSPNPSPNPNPDPSPNPSPSPSPNPNPNPSPHPDQVAVAAQRESACGPGCVGRAGRGGCEPRPSRPLPDDALVGWQGGPPPVQDTLCVRCRHRGVHRVRHHARRSRLSDGQPELAQVAPCAPPRFNNAPTPRVSPLCPRPSALSRALIKHDCVPVRPPHRRRCGPPMAPRARVARQRDGG